MARSSVDGIIRKGATCLATVSYPAYKILAGVYLPRVVRANYFKYG